MRALALLALCACSKTADPPPAPAKPAPAHAPADAIAIDAGFAVWPATLEDRSANLEWHDMKATITARVPVGWKSSSAGYFTIPGELARPMQPSIHYGFGNISCNGACKDADMQRSMAEMWTNAEIGYAQVSYNSGNERMDHMKLDVKVLGEGTFTDGTYKAGKWKAVRVTRPADAMDVPAFMERVEATCARHRSKDKYYIVATVVMPLEYEQTLFPLMLEACKTPWFR